MPTTIRFERTASAFPKWFGNDSGHLGVLVVAWAYILSARWAEIMPGASIYYTERDETLQEIHEERTPKKEFILSTGAKHADGLHWWNALLAPDRSWCASISKSGITSISPWSTSISILEDSNVRVTGIEWTDKAVAGKQSFSVPSSEKARQYLMEYCEYHSTQNQCAAALSVALVLPLVRSGRRFIRFPVPQSPAKRSSSGLSSTFTTLSHEQLDKLLTLSCDRDGIQAILSSCFLNPDVPGNVCSHYLQGIFAVIDSIDDTRARTSLLMRGLGRMGFLWLGAALAELQDGLLNLFRERISEPELHSAVWTQTLQSFIQKPVFGLQNGRVARADECKLLFLTQTKWHTNPPLSPWPLFGTTELKDVNLEVEEHIRCASHCLHYESWTWSCRDKYNPVSHRPSHSISRLHTAQSH